MAYNSCSVAYAESFRGEGAKFRHNLMTSQINFMGSAEKNQNPGRTLNTREKPALVLLKLLGFALHFFIFRVLFYGTVASPLGTLVLLLNLAVFVDVLA